MPVIADSYMGMFLPSDISERLVGFISGNLNFPIIKENELMGAFYLFGKDYGISGQTEVLSATDLAKRTIEQLSRNVRSFHHMPNKLSLTAIREEAMKRALQISIELQQQQQQQQGHIPKLNERIARDPVILSSCFSQHIAYYKKDYFFELFQPFNKNDLPVLLRSKLEGRMLLLVFNVKNLKSLPYKSSLLPFIHWIEKITDNTSKV
ncbi:MAG TPA: hypothetical protein VKA09_00160 [Nitrososphaeraceae archaeon]|nr:hypothetical protein [Nitrososphaeraceae archaeon]